MKKIRVTAEQKQVRVLCQFVVEVLELAGMTEEFCYSFELAVDEVCTNIVEHGYGYHAQDKYIELGIEPFSTGYRVLVWDEAPAFNPLLMPDPDLSTPLENRVSGGVGILFTKKKMDLVAYDWQSGRNCLILEKYF